MTIDEMISHEKDVVEHIYIEIMLCHTNPDDEKLDERIKEGKYHEQIAELLEDYKRVKKWKDDVIDEICKYDANSVEELVHNARQKAINDFTERLKDILMDYFDVNNDTYAYNLTRDKKAFGVGTMTFDDFEEFSEETIDDIVEYIKINV